ncbi:MAG TPA: chemotaxis protein CheW [Steroidobacteraceae bacterium]
MQDTKVPGEEAGGSDGARKVLTFSLGGEVYGVDILRVKEIRGWTPVTRIPQSPQAMLGVLNLRGIIVPIVDLRVRFGLPAAEFNAVTVTIVLSLQTAAGDKEYGFVVDSVRDVVDLTSASIRPAPEVGSTAANEYIEAIATHDEQMLILLDAGRLASPEQSCPGVADQAA